MRPQALGGGDRRLELRASVERVRALAGLNLDEFLRGLEVFQFGERAYPRALRFDAQARAALAFGRHADIGDNRLQSVPVRYSILAYRVSDRCPTRRQDPQMVRVDRPSNCCFLRCAAAVSGRRAAARR